MRKILLIFLLVFSIATPVFAQEYPPPKSIEDTLLEMETPFEFSAWLHGIEFNGERAEMALNNSLPCEAQNPQDTYNLGSGICMDYAALIGLWCQIQEVDCYQVVYVYRERNIVKAHVYMMMPELEITMQNNGVIHRYPDEVFL